ncbi:unnamed protein product [Lampetra fluviatilis]
MDNPLPDEASQSPSGVGSRSLISQLWESRHPSVDAARAAWTPGHWGWHRHAAAAFTALTPPAFRHRRHSGEGAAGALSILLLLLPPLFLPPRLAAGSDPRPLLHQTKRALDILDVLRCRWLDAQSVEPFSSTRVAQCRLIHGLERQRCVVMKLLLLLLTFDLRCKGLTLEAGDGERARLVVEEKTKERASLGRTVPERWSHVTGSDAAAVRVPHGASDEATLVRATAGTRRQAAWRTAPLLGQEAREASREGRDPRVTLQHCDHTEDTAGLAAGRADRSATAPRPAHRDEDFAPRALGDAALVSGLLDGGIPTSNENPQRLASLAAAPQRY